jgi:hypothetical protein
VGFRSAEKGGGEVEGGERANVLEQGSHQGQHQKGEGVMGKGFEPTPRLKPERFFRSRELRVGRLLGGFSTVVYSSVRRGDSFPCFACRECAKSRFFASK